MVVDVGSEIIAIQSVSFVLIKAGGRAGRQTIMIVPQKHSENQYHHNENIPCPSQYNIPI